MDSEAVANYLHRLGVKPSSMNDAAYLFRLHEAHLRTIPFENLSIHLGEPIDLEPAALLDKVVARRRGGFCFELNGAFALLLAALGFEVSLHAARVWGDGRFGPPLAHLALRVDCPDPYLVDVGFGEHSVLPLRLDSNDVQRDQSGSFTVVAVDENDVDVVKDGVVQYRLELRSRALADFEPLCWWHQTSPRSRFTATVICSKRTERGRVTLSGNRLIETDDATRSERQVPDDDALATYRDVFGLDLDRVPIPLTASSKERRT